MKLSLFSRFANPARQLRPQSYVHAVRIEGLSDPFDAEDLWMAPRMAYTGEAARLRQTLEARPERLQGRKIQQVFSQVQVLLPSATIVRDRRAARGGAASAMAARLAELHREDFGDKVGSGPVRYQVMGSDDVPEGSALVRFGLGIYVPGGSTGSSGGGVVRFPVEPGSADSPDLRCRLEVSVDGGIIFTPLSVVHPDERLVILGSDPLRASYAVSGWPFSSDHLLVLVNEPGQPLELGAEPYGSLQVRAGSGAGDHVVATPDGEPQTPPLVLRVVDDRPNAGASARRGASNDAVTARQDETTIREFKPGVIRPLEAVTPAVPTEETRLPDPDVTFVANRPPATPVADPLSAQTYVPQVRQPLPRLALAGLVLQRVSLYGSFGVTGLRIGFDATLQLADAKRPAWLTLEIDALDRLTVTTRSGTQELKLPARFTHRERLLEIRQAPCGMQTHCVGLLLNDFGASEPVSPGMPLITGRGQRLLSSLRVLDGLGCIVRADQQAATSDDQMGLSRRAFSLEVDGMTLKIAQLAINQRLFHLDEDCGLLAELNGSAHDTATLRPGHYLAGSHYLWRFEVPEAR